MKNRLYTAEQNSTSIKQLNKRLIAYIVSQQTITAEQQEALTDTQLFAVCDFLKNQQA